MRVLLAGMWARRGLNAAILLITVTAIATSVLGPMYGRASAEHLLDTRIDQRAPYETGLSYSVPALAPANLPVGDPDTYRPPAPFDVIDEARPSLESPTIDRFWHPARRWLMDRGGQLAHGSRVFEAPLYWREGMCELAQVEGTCPTRAGDVLVQATMARTLGVTVGGHITLGYTDTFLNSALAGVEAGRTRQQTFNVVGTYQITNPDSADWFDLSRFQGVENLGSAPPPPNAASADPTAPALLVSPKSMTSQTFVGGLDRPIDTSAVDLDTMTEVENEVARFRTGVLDVSTAGQLQELDVTTLFDEVRSERSLLSQVTIAALAPLVVLALLLLYALVVAAAAIRRPYVALAKLRGQSAGQVLRFALSEPYLVVAAAAPIGVAIAWGSAQVIARTWLRPGIPVVIDNVALAGLVSVTLAALVAAAAAALGVIREPLSAALASSVRPGPSTRSSLVLRSAVVAVAVASVAQILASGDRSTQLLGLLAPLFIALATAIGGVLLLNLVTRWWVDRTRNRAGTATYLASRRLARRQDLTKLMIPLLLAVSVITFAASASANADDWRVSRAKADVGAPRTFLTDADPGRLLKVTHEVDPEGKYVAAAVVENGGDNMDRRVLMDTSRLSAVAAWDGAWSEKSLLQLQRRLEPKRSAPVTFTGNRVSVTVRDVRLDTGDNERPVLWLRYVDDVGEQTDVALGELVNGSERELSAELEGCGGVCTVGQLYVSGSSSSVSDTQGRLTLAHVSVDLAPVDWRLAEGGAWRASRPFPVSLVDPPVVLEPTSTGLRLKLYLGHLPPAGGEQPVMLSGYARITPSGTPEVVPVLVTDSTETGAPAAPSSGIGFKYPRDVVVGTALNGEKVPMRVAGVVTALPGLGDVGALSDLQSSLVEFGPPAGMVLDVQLWAAQDTPASVLTAVRDAGITLSDERRVDTTLNGLRSDAFSLGWRIFLIVGGLTLLLAIFGVLASAVAQSRWRSYEVASLRLVGVKQRALVRASVLEYVVMLGFAVLLGIVSAYLALVLVLPSINLGNAGEHDPSPVYSIHWEIVGVVGGSVFVLAAVIAVLVSRRITRLGRPSTLRWAEQG